MSSEKKDRQEPAANQNDSKEQADLQDSIPVELPGEELIELEPRQESETSVSSLNDLQKLLEEAEKRIEEHNNQYMRAQAELQNVRRRAERDIANAHKYALENFIQDLLPVIDSLEKGLEASESHQEEATEALKKGVELTLKMMLDVLKKFGVEQIDPIGEPFDPEKHEAMSMQENNDVEANTVTAVFQKGFILNGRLVRAAKVIVSKPKAETSIDEKV